MNRDNLEYLFQKTINRILSTPEELCRFLDTSAAVYKYPIANQTLIHNFIPSPVAVATFEQWKRLNRNVNRGATGAYRFSPESTKGFCVDLFDVSDTNGPDDTYPRLWEYPKEYSVYGVLGLNEESSDRETEIRDIVDETVGTVLATESESNDIIRTVAPHHEMISAAIAYTLQKRLGFPTSYQESILQSAFYSGDIQTLTDQAKRNILSVVTNTSTQLLKRIERSVKHGEYKQRASSSEQERLEETRAAATRRNNNQERTRLSAQQGNGNLSPDNRGTDAGQIRAATAEISAREQRPESDATADGTAVLDVSGGSGRTSGNDVHDVVRTDDEERIGPTGISGTGSVAEPDRRGGSRTGYGGTERNDLISSLTGIPANEIQPIISALAYDDGMTNLPKRIGAFFAENPESSARMEFLKQVYGISAMTWDISTEPKEIKTSDSGITVRITAKTETGLVDTVNRSITWEQATSIFDRITADNLFYKREEKNSIFIGKKRSTTVPLPPNVSIPTQTSLFNVDDTALDDDAYMREELLKTSDADKHRIAELLQNASTSGEAANWLSQHYGFQGGTRHYSDNTFAIAKYSSEGVVINFYGQKDGTERKEKFSWRYVVKMISQMIEDGIYLPAATEQRTEKPAPTLAELLARPDMVKIGVIEQGEIQISEVEANIQMLRDSYGVHAVSIPHPDIADTWMLYAGDWLNKELPANIWMNDNQILFGRVTLFKMIDGKPVNPFDEDISRWREWTERSVHVFSTEQIAQIVQQERANGQMAAFYDREAFLLADSMNPSNRVRVLVVPPRGTPEERFIENSEQSFRMHIGCDSIEYGALEDGIDYITTSDPGMRLNQHIHGEPVYGTFLVAQTDLDSGDYINIDPEIAERYQQLLAPEGIAPRIVITEQHGDIAAADEYDRRSVDVSTNKPSAAKSSDPKSVPEPQPPNPPNYRYPEGAGMISSGAKTRFRDNVNAITLLYTLEIEKRYPDAQEQEVLAKYAGWGGLPDAFNENNAAWKDEYEELRQLLNPEEYAAARASTTTSFYTPLPVIKAIYQALENFGIPKDARLLEPSCGTGRFFGGISFSLVNAQLYGIELDSIPARISQKLYPNANIRHDGFERTQFSDNRFDAAIGNVPFGDFRLADARYDKYHFLIHDYFLAKSLDMVRPGGVVAFVTSAGTMDKKNANVRKYLAERAELIGAVRLPNTAFKSTGTSITTDILFLQKRELLRDPAEEKPQWTEITEGEHGINCYFDLNPDMILGKMELVSGRFGYTLECLPDDTVDLEYGLERTISSLKANIPERAEDIELGSIPAPPEVRNFTFTVLDGTLYYREHDLLLPENMKATEIERIVGMCGIRDTAGELIRLQPTFGSDREIEELRAELNSRYDSFVKRFGNLADQTNVRLFRKDIDCSLLLALENRAENGEMEKTDIFSRRTVNPRREVSEVDNAQDALSLSLNYRGSVDVEYMESIYRKDGQEIIRELGEVLYLNPSHYSPEQPCNGWEIAGEYLSGNVRKKLTEAHSAAEQYPDLFSRNVQALEQNLPEWIEAGQIEARLGAAWIGKDYFTQFMYETFGTPNWIQGNDNRSVHMEYNSYNSRWTIYNKNDDSGVKAREIFGTKRANAYSILEDTLNLKDTEVKDQLPNKSYVLNVKETELARSKQTLIKNAFAEWIFKDPERRHRLEEKYNELFNSIRIRQYDGSDLTLPGLSSSFTPRPHQKDAVARICDMQNNTLLDHVVGAGKTATMIIGGYELNRLDLSKRSMFAVPNHIVGQFRDDIYKLYPDVKAMIVTEADFEKSNRQKFLSRIIYSDVNMIVLGHTQFERIMMSPEYQMQTLEKEISELTAAISDIKRESGARWTVKQMEQQTADLQASILRLQQLNKKDQIVTFEQMGIDALFVDEADMFKNCYIFSKLRNVAGIGTANSQRAADMLLKCRYLSEHGGKVVFATGTPISNALSEMYVMQRYLQENTLHEHGIYHFDEWVSDFAETTTSLELAPEGTGFRQRTRLAKYFNIPELMQLYRQVADVQTADMLDYLPKPKIKDGEPEIIVCNPSAKLEAWVQDGVGRCRAIRNRKVDPSEDNMLKFTMEARLASLDMRLVDPEAGYDPQGKISRCADKLMAVYQETMNDKGFQLVFCDSSTPQPGKFNVYAELKRVCMEKGIPDDEIAFIHDAKNGKQRDALFQKCRNGDIRILIGSTEKCGAGTNIQDRMAAIHHLDCPYRPRDIEQREGRGLRQGNMYPEMPVFRYVTERSFDAYLWNIVATKQRFISQIRQSSNGQRVFEDKDEMLLSFETVQAIATGNPLIMEKINLDNELSRLQLLQTEHRNQQYRLEDSIPKYTREIERLEMLIKHIRQDMQTASKHQKDVFQMTVNGRLFENREEAGTALLEFARTNNIKEEHLDAGEYLGMKLTVYQDSFTHLNRVKISGAHTYRADLNEASGTGTATRIDNVIKGLPDEISRVSSTLSSTKQSLEAAKAELGKPFPFAEKLADGLVRQSELNVLLSLKDDEPNVIQPDEEAENTGENKKSAAASVSERGAPVGQGINLPEQDMDPENDLDFGADDI